MTMQIYFSRLLVARGHFYLVNGVNGVLIFLKMRSRPKKLSLVISYDVKQMADTLKAPWKYSKFMNEYLQFSYLTFAHFLVICRKFVLNELVLLLT